MYKLVSDGNVIGLFEKVSFVKKSASNVNVSCPCGEADAIVAGNQVYAMTDAKAYADCVRVAVFDVDSAVENSAELAFIKAMANLV